MNAAYRLAVETRASRSTALDRGIANGLTEAELAPLDAELGCAVAEEERLRQEWLHDIAEQDGRYHDLIPRGAR